MIAPFGDISVGKQLAGWTFSFESAGAVAPIIVRPGRVDLPPDAPEVTASLTLMKNSTPGDAAFLFGAASSSRLEIGSFAVGAEFSAALEGSQGDLNWGLWLSLGDGLLAVVPSDADGFVGSLIGSGVSMPFDLAMRWTRHTGLNLDGGAGLRLSLPFNTTLGPISLQAITVELAPIGDGVAITARATLTADLSVLVVTVDGVGVGVDIGAPPSGGNFGPLDLGLAPLAPNGIGIAIDVGAVSGGGYLDIDAAAGSYQGVIDIDVLGVGVSAVVIIETDVPDVDGWSMFFALFLGLPSIQLGFGFTLTGVGGVAGINRTLDPEALGAAVRAGALDAVLFPDDPIGDAPLIIDTFKAIFPAADGQYVFGPMVRLGWGTPTLVEAELGIVIALPDPIIIAILGSVSSVLPTPDIDLIAINLDVAGVIDFTAQSLQISASLHDSHVIGFALSGDMELRAGFGSQPSFLMALGGFHPDFDPPAGFPTLRRLTVGCSNPVIDISFECYLALDLQHRPVRRRHRRER